MDTKPVRSPSYPSMSLEDAVKAVAKIEKDYRSSPVDRANGVKLIGYSSLSGPANKALAALASFGLVERAGKGMLRVTTLARTILHPQDDNERNAALMEAAVQPRLFQDIRERFRDIPIPPEDGVRTYLEREGFNSSAVGPAAEAFLETARSIEQHSASESHVNQSPDETGSEVSDGDDDLAYGRVRVGDFVQWKSQGVAQFPKPLRVRSVSDDGQWIAVEGSRTGIPMSEVVVETSAPRQPPTPPVFDYEEQPAGFEEWFRVKVGPEKQVQISYRGEGDVGPKEIQKLIDILTAQKAALED